MIAKRKPDPSPLEQVCIQAVEQSRAFQGYADTLYAFCHSNDVSHGKKAELEAAANAVTEAARRLRMLGR